MLNSLTTLDGLTLHLHQTPPLPEARGTVVLVHGLGEHCGRYAHVCAALNDAGWNVVSFDHRGHGRSQGERGSIPDDAALLVDLSQVVELARSGTPGPIVLLGHSMGGLIVGRYAAEGTLPDPAPWFRAVDGVVLSSPALDIGITGGKKVQLALMRWLAPNLAVPNGLKPSWVSRDPAVVAAYQADPLVHDRVTPRLVSFLKDGGEFVRRQAGQWKLPTLLLFAGADRCVAPAGSRAFAASAPRSLVSTQEYPALYHEIFNEPEKAEVLQRLTDWLASR